MLPLVLATLRESLALDVGDSAGPSLCTQPLSCASICFIRWQTTSIAAHAHRLATMSEWREAPQFVESAGGLLAACDVRMRVLAAAGLWTPEGWRDTYDCGIRHYYHSHLARTGRCHAVW